MAACAGASVVGTHGAAPTRGSTTATLPSVTLPVLVTVKVYSMTSPSSAIVPPPRIAACLSTTRPGVGVSVAITLSAGGLMTVESPGPVADAVAVLEIRPASTSACVTVYVAAQVPLSPGASVAMHATGPVRLSRTVTAVSVTLPVLVTVKV